MGRRTIFFIIFFVGILLLVVVGVVFFTQQNEQAEPAPPAEGTPVVEEGAEAPDGVTGGEQAAPNGAAPPVSTGPEGEISPEDLVEVVVSIQTVPRGWVMTEAEVTTDLRLAAEVGNNVLTDLDEAIGMIARTDIFQGQTLTESDLVDDPTMVGEETFGPSSLIPTGFVAQAVPLDRLSGVAYGLAEGDTIDIMLSFAFSEVDPEFQTLLENSAEFVIESTDEEGNVTLTVVTLDPFGRFEELPTGELVQVIPGTEASPIIVSMILQNAKVIQVGDWEPVEPIIVPTPTPEPDLLDEDGATPTPQAETPPTPTPEPPSVLLVALSPQQQLLLKYAVEVGANIDYALRGINDSQLYAIDNVDLNYLLETFNIEIPPDYDFTVEYGNVDGGGGGQGGSDSQAAPAPAPEAGPAPTPAPDEQ